MVGGKFCVLKAWNYFYLYGVIDQSLCEVLKIGNIVSDSLVRFRVLNISSDGVGIFSR